MDRRIYVPEYQPDQGIPHSRVLQTKHDHLTTERNIYGEFHHIENTIYLTTCFTISCGGSRLKYLW
jgi:hypothetical protein